MRINNCYIGREAKTKVDRIFAEKEKYLNDLGLDEYPPPYVKGFYNDGEVFVAFDNTDKTCDVEEFEKMPDAIEWLDVDLSTTRVDNQQACPQCGRQMHAAELILGPVCGCCVAKNHKRATRK